MSEDPSRKGYVKVVTPEGNDVDVLAHGWMQDADFAAVVARDDLTDCDLYGPGDWPREYVVYLSHHGVTVSVDMQFVPDFRTTIIPSSAEVSS